MRLNKIFILFVVGLMGCVAAKSQPPAPAGLPSVNTTNYYKIGWIQSDSGFISALRDTTVRSRFPGLEFMWQHSGVDTSKWLWNGLRYVKQLNSQDTIKFLVTPSFLASQGFLKNISGLLNQGTGGIKITGNGTLFSPYVVSDTSAGVIDSAVNPGLFLHQNIVGTTKTLLADTSFATGFSGYYLRRIDSNLYVTPTQLATKQGIITTGTTLQYFRGDLSLATFPTNLSAFTNGPGYISGNQPITFTANSSGDVTGTFTNPTVLTPLLTLKNTGIGAGSCTNCNVSIDAQGRVTNYANGSGGSGGSNSNIGSGFRFAVPNTNNIKTLFCSGCTLDSTTNTNALTLTVTAGGSGTVTSVAQTIPTSLLTIGGSPITTAGTLAIGLANAGAHSYWGNNTGSSGAPLYVTNTQLTADLNLFTTTLQGLVPLSGGGTTNFLRADGTWAAPPGGGSGGTLVNLGAGYRIGFPNTNNLRTLFCAGCTLDSTTNTNGLTLTVSGSVTPTFQQTLTQGNALTKADTINQAGHNFTFTGGGQVKLDSLKLTQLTSFTAATVLNAFGNSITAGQGASVADSEYIVIYSTSLGVSLINNALSGSGMWESAKDANADLSIPDNTMNSVAAGFNDVRRSGNNPLTFRKVNNGLDNMLVGHFAKSSTAGALANLYGTWSVGYNATSVGGKSTNGAYTTLLNDSITYIFKDSTVFWATIGTDSSYGASNYSEAVQVFIDNILIQTVSLDNQTDGISDGVYDNRRSPMAFFYHGFNPNVNHTLKLVNKTAHSYFLVVDYFGTLMDASLCRPFLVMESEKLTPGGYAVPPNSASNAIIDSLNKKLDSTVSAFITTYPIRIGKTNNFFVPTTDIGPDSVHPNDQGHRHWADAAKAALPSVTNGGVYATPGSIYYVGTGYKGVLYDGTIIDLGGGSGPSGNFIEASPLTPQNDFFDVAQNSRVRGMLSFGQTGGTSSSNPAFKIFTGGAFGFTAYQTGGANLFLSGDSSTTVGLPLTIAGRTLDLGYFTSGIGKTLHIDSSGTTIGDGVTGDLQVRIKTGIGTLNFFDFGSRNIIESGNSGRTADNPLTINASDFIFSLTRTGGNNVGRIAPTTGNLLWGTQTDVASSLFTLASTTKGFLPPRMTLAQATAISSPATSLHFVLTDSAGRLGLWNGTKIITYATTDMLSSGGAQTLTATQLATTINIAISGGNNQNLALANATHAGLVDSARWFFLDSLYRGLKVFNLFAANGLTAAGGDSFYLGGALNQNTTIATAGFSLSLTGLPNKATALSTDSVPLIDIAGKMWKLPVPSGGGGSGTVTSVATGLGLSGGTITTTGTLLLDTSYAVTKSSAQVISGAKIFSASTNINAAFATNSTVNLTGLTNTAGGASFKVVAEDTLTGKLWNVPFYTTDTTGYASGLHFFTFNGTKIVLAKDTSIYNSDGTIAGARTVSTGANLLSIHGNSTTHSGLDLSTTSFYYGFPGALNTDANITVADGYPQVQLAVITANRTITLPSSTADGGRILVINNPAQTFIWSFATTVNDPAGNTITNLTPSTVYVLEAINSQWLIIGQYGSGDNLRYNHTIFTPSTGGTVTLVNNRYNIINPTTGLATLTITLPSSPANNDVVYVKFTQAVAAVTYSGGTVLGGLAAPIVGSVVVFTYDSSTSTWY